MEIDKLKKNIPENVNFGLNELSGLESLMSKTKNERILKILQADIDNFRSKLVTKVINESFPLDIPPVEPIIFPFDPKRYLLSNIRGYEKKINVIKSCHPNLPDEKIIDALIRFEGNEEETIGGLLSEDPNSFPPFPTIPKKVIKRHKKNQKREIKVYQERKKASSRKKPIILLTDINNSKKSKEVDIRRRIEIVKFEAKNVDNILFHTKPFEFNKKNTEEKEEEEEYKTYEAWNNNKQKPNSASHQERLYLIGEEIAIRNGTPRTFKFLPERTFSSDISHVHYRVAESQFYRLVGCHRGTKVEEVKYIVTPNLIKKFENYKQKIISLSLSSSSQQKNKTRLKQYLLYSPCRVDDYHDYSSVENKNIIDRIRLENYSSKSFKRGRLFTTRRDICEHSIFSRHHHQHRNNNCIILSLVITGREKTKKIESTVNNKMKKKIKLNTKMMMKKKNTKGAFGDEKISNYENTTYDYLTTLGILSSSSSSQKKNHHTQKQEKEEREIGLEFDSIVDPSKDTMIVFQQDQILPYYIVKYSNSSSIIHQQFFRNNKHLADEWTNMKDSATADKQQEEIKKTYLQILEQKERDMKDKKFYESYFEKEVTSQKKEEPPQEEGEGEDIDEDNLQFQSPGSPSGEEEEDTIFDSSGSPNLDDEDFNETSPVFDDDDEEEEEIDFVDE